MVRSCGRCYRPLYFSPHIHFSEFPSLLRRNVSALCRGRSALCGWRRCQGDGDGFHFGTPRVAERRLSFALRKLKAKLHGPVALDMIAGRNLAPFAVCGRSCSLRFHAGRMDHGGACELGAARADRRRGGGRGGVPACEALGISRHPEGLSAARAGQDQWRGRHVPRRYRRVLQHVDARRRRQVQAQRRLELRSDSKWWARRDRPRWDWPEHTTSPFLVRPHTARTSSSCLTT